MNKALALGQLNPIRRITAQDCKVAETLIIRYQYYEAHTILKRYVSDRNLKSFQNGKRVHRETTRMKNSSFTIDAKNLVLLLPNHPLTQVILKYHKKILYVSVAHTVVAVRGKYLVRNFVS